MDQRMAFADSGIERQTGETEVILVEVNFSSSSKLIIM